MRKIDLSGEKFGRLTVISEAEGINGRTQWNCVCDCGSLLVGATAYLRCGDTKSCGCLSKDVPNRLSHGHNRVGKRSRTYRIWAGMKTRCGNEKATDYKWYGGRGVTVCAQWMRFDSFLYDMGEAPKRLTIDRIDNNGNYEPGNCRWATMKQQRSNTSKSIFVSMGGKITTIPEAAAATGINVSTLYYRHSKGLPLDKAGDIDRIAEYNVDDVEKARMIHKRLTFSEFW
ncbi:MAG: hypothetical protein KUG81_10010 [Gammaproteobacteria bacterium]|nr:hypothetical protein [Gammaproteobacteria bacterium]